jgi:flavin-dependent dehydrogenase
LAICLKVWRPIGFATWASLTDFLNHPAGHACHIDRCFFETRLAERAAEVGVRRLETSRSVGIRRHKRGWVVDLENHHTLQADILIDASGRSASTSFQAFAAETKNKTASKDVATTVVHSSSAQDLKLN